MISYNKGILTFNTDSFWKIASKLSRMIGISLIIFALFIFIWEKNHIDSLQTASTHNEVISSDRIEVYSDLLKEAVYQVWGGNTSTYEEYVVQSGDSLSKIAKRFNTTVQELLAINQINNPNLIYSNDKIQVPPNNGDIPEKEKETVIIAAVTSLSRNDYLNYDLRSSSNLTQSQINIFLEGSPMEGLGSAFIAAEEKYKVNAKYLMAHAIHESNWGRSKIAADKNNLFGLKAFDSDPYKNAMSFSTFEASIDYTAGYIDRYYLSSDGKYYNGANLLGMNIFYATSNEWAYNIAAIMEAFDRTVFVG